MEVLGINLICEADLYHTMYCLCGLSTYGGVLSVVTLLMIKCRMILIAFIALSKEVPENA